MRNCGCEHLMTNVMRLSTTRKHWKHFGTKGDRNLYVITTVLTYPFYSHEKLKDITRNVFVNTV